MSDQKISKEQMEELNSYVVLFHVLGTMQLSVQGVLAPSSEFAMAIVSESLVEQGQGENIVVGTFDKADYESLGGVFEMLDEARKEMASQ